VAKAPMPLLGSLELIMDCSQHGVGINGVVIDTDVFVAARFNAKSASTRILAAVREGDFQLVCNKPTRGATETILRRVPGLDWARVADLYQPEGEFTGPSIPTPLS